ncbi:MAG TPA: response regulator transcription factor [Chroococcales cyanobacterium]
MAHILLAEDDQFLSDALSKTLRHSGYKVDQVKNGVDAETQALCVPYDLMILDLGLPQRDGSEVLESLRRQGKTLPVLILTALDTPADRIRGLDSGANDYICKPCDVGELEARIRALLRTNKWSNRTEVRAGNLCFDTAARKVTINDEPVDLSLREFTVLELLLQRKGRVVFKNDFIAQFSDLDRDVTSNALDIIVHRLRKKIDGSGCVIQTVRGLGFMVE